MNKVSLNFHLTEHNRKIAYKKLEGKSTEEPGIIFLGGLASDMEGTKANFLEDWCRSRGNTFIRFDYSGHGQSEGVFTDGSILTWSEDALSVLDNLTNKKQILIGSSMGGWIALILAKKRPKKIHSMIGIAAAPDFTEDLMWDNFGQDEKNKIIRHGIIEQDSEYSDEPYKISKNLIFESRNCFVLRDKIELNFPVRLLQGTSDNDVPLNTAINLINHITCEDAKLEIIKQGLIKQNSEYSDEPYTISKNLILESRNCFVLRDKIELNFPVRLLQGTLDNDVPLNTALKLINHITCEDAKLEIVKNADHSFSTEECLKLISSTLLKLLEKK